MKTRRFRMLTVLLISAILVIGSVATVYAASISSLKYQGKGKVSITFADSVKYDSVKVTAKDNSGKSYSVTGIKTSATGITFTIKGYKTGKTYKITVSGFSDGDKASKTFKIYSKSEAINIAKKKAKKMGASTFADVNAKGKNYKSSSYCWYVTFTSGEYSYKCYVSQQTGKILYFKKSS